VVEPVGSATTLLAEALQRRAVEVGPIHATLMAIGIHVDTGSLTFAASSGRDAAALAWLMDRGASLSVLNRYLRTPFGAAQRDALREILGTCVVESIRGARIAFAMLQESVGRLDEVVSEATALQDVHAMFAIAPTRGGAQVVARSRAAFIDVGRILTSVGGGGHATASAATVRGKDPAALSQAIREYLESHPPRPERVRDVMSSPVRTIGTKAPLREARSLLQHGRWTGLPVVKNGKVVGVLSRRDLQRAETEQKLDRPVGHEMSAPPRTVPDDVLLEDAQGIMESEDIGRLPVLRDGKLVGIVTRSDLLGFLYRPRK
jgi:tRNA nucleotidyltransferase (CCA-adding enzyme)